MIVDVEMPRGIKPDEYCAAPLPVGAEELSAAGHTVLIDQQYEVAGATIVNEAAEVWLRAEPVVQVRESMPQEWPPSEGPPRADTRPDAAAIPPARRAGLVISPPRSDGKCVVSNSHTGAYLYLGEQEAFLLEQLDGEQTAESICLAFEARFGLPLSEEELDEFVELARAEELLHPAGAAETVVGGDATGPAPTQPSHRPRQSILAWRIRLLDPDRLLTWLEPKLRLVWTGPFLVLSAAAILIAATVLWTGRHELTQSLAYFLQWQSLALIWVTVMAISFGHEFAHGLTCKHYGGKVHEMGFLVLFCMPCLYCNVSDSWLFRERWKRIAVMLAGSYYELILWTAAVFMWRVTLPGSLPHNLSWVVISVVVGRVIFNFNPFLKLDGYYILSDLLDLPNLRQRSLATMMGHLRRLLWGAPRPERQPRGQMLLAYGIVTWFFSLGFLALILIGLLHFLTGVLGLVGLGLAALLGTAIMRPLFQGFFAGEVSQMIRQRRKSTIVWAAVLGLLPPVLALEQIEEWASGPCQVRSQSQVEIRAPIAGFLREVWHEEGDQVSPGDLIARLEVPDLDSRLERARAAVCESQARLRLLEVGPRPLEVEEQRRRVVRAEAWRDLAGQDLARARQVLQEELKHLDEQIAQSRAELDYAENVLARDKRLGSRGLVAEQQHQEMEEKYRIALAQNKQAQAQKRAREVKGTLEAEVELDRRKRELAEARSTLTLLEAGTRPEEIEAERARLAQLKTEVSYLEGLQAKILVTSPVAGRLTTPYLRELVGHYYREGELICEIKAPSILEAEISVNEQDLAQICPGQRVDLKFRTLVFQKLHARVDKVAPIAVSPQQIPNAPAPTPGEVPSTVRVLCHLEDSTPALRPGVTGYAHIACGRRPIWEIVAKRLLRFLRTEYWW